MEKPVKSHEDDSCENIQNGVANLVFKHVRVIQETVFNLCCPQCKTAFFEFTGCAAVTCGTCNAGFCGLCLAHCGTSSESHAHVRTCSKNPTESYFVTKLQLDAIHVDMRNRKLRDYLQLNKLSANVQQQIIEKIRKDLTDLGLSIPVVLANSYHELTTENSTEVMRHVRKIQENILTLSCPSCKAAFFDFDGCAAVTCISCRMEFCGLCLDFTSSNVRLHVLSCQRNSMQGHSFLNANELLRIHTAVRTDRIQSYFDEKITDAQTKEKVLSIVRRDLTDLQIGLPNITARQRVRVVEAERQPRFQQPRPYGFEEPIRRPVAPPQPPPRYREAPQPAPRYREAPRPAPQRLPKRECCIL